MHDLGSAGGATIPAATHFLRPDFFDQAISETLPDWAQHLPTTNQPSIYITLGTEANSEPGIYPYVLQTIIAGLRDLPLNLIVTLGRDKDPADFGAQPSNVHIERYIPQSLLLPHCDLVLMHGGTNTLLQTFDAGLPVVITPLIADQFFNAEITLTLQLGQVVQTWHPQQPGQLDLELLTPTVIHGAVEEVLGNSVYRQNVAQLQAEMHALPGQQYAVHLVEKVATEREPVLNTRLPSTPT
jgi:MGT family glycosyltransferase